MIEHERVLAAMQTQADTIERLERELAEVRAFAAGLEANLTAVIQRAEAAEEALRALANANANRAA
jgi:uncharacterized coiled-coil protein SlyX